MKAIHSHYYKNVSHLKTIDVYRVLQLFEVTDPCVQHAIKKLLVADALEELERALCVIGVVGNVDGHDVIRRESVIDVARQSIKRNAEGVK